MGWYGGGEWEWGEIPGTTWLCCGLRHAFVSLSFVPCETHSFLLFSREIIEYIKNCKFSLVVIEATH